MIIPDLDIKFNLNSTFKSFFNSISGKGNIIRFGETIFNGEKYILYLNIKDYIIFCHGVSEKFLREIKDNLENKNKLNIIKMILNED